MEFPLEVQLQAQEALPLAHLVETQPPPVDLLRVEFQECNRLTHRHLLQLHLHLQ